MKTPTPNSPAIVIPARPPEGKRKSSPEYMRWYRAAKKAGLSTSPKKKTPAQRKAWRREYQRNYRTRLKAKGNQE